MDTRESRWLLRAAFVAGAALALLAAGAAMEDGALLLVGLGLLIVAYGLAVVAEARAGEQRAPHLLAGAIAFVCVALLAALLSSVVAIFVGAAAFRWMAGCLPLAAAWLVLSGAIARFARRIARRRPRG